jgi:hypothetical protein
VPSNQIVALNELYCSVSGKWWGKPTNRGVGHQCTAHWYGVTAAAAAVAGCATHYAPVARIKVDLIVLTQKVSSNCTATLQPRVHGAQTQPTQEREGCSTGGTHARHTYKEKKR